MMWFKTFRFILFVFSIINSVMKFRNFDLDFQIKGGQFCPPDLIRRKDFVPDWVPGLFHPLE